MKTLRLIKVKPTRYVSLVNHDVFYPSHSVDAPTWEAQGNKWDPRIHIIVSSVLLDELAAVEAIIQTYATSIVAHFVCPAFLDCISIELQFGDTPEDQKALLACRQDYNKWYDRPKKRTTATKRLAKERMYILPDGREFFYGGKWDNYGLLWGQVQSSDDNFLERAVVQRSELERATLVAKNEERWLPM